MYKPLTCLLLPIFLIQLADAQTIGTPYPKDKTLIEEGIELHDEEKYASAIAKYTQVHPNDSFYSEALFEMSSSYLAHKQYKLAAEAALKGLNLKNSSRREFLISYANALEESGMVDSAIATYNLGIKEFPFFNRYQYERGLTQLKQKQFKASLASYTESLKNNIFHPATHYRIGLLAAEAKQPTIALLAMQTFLILNTNNSTSAYAVNYMEKIAGNEYTPEFEVPESLFGNDPAIKEIDEIILSKAALSNKYKGRVKLNLWVIKQIQVTLEKLPENFQSENEAVNFYVRFYHEIWKNNMFEGMMLHSLKGIDNKDIQKEVKSGKSKIEEFAKWGKTYLDNYRNNREVMLNGKMVKTKLWYDGHSLFAMGDVDATGSNNAGYWQYYKNGYKSSEGMFNSAGKKTGKWRYYFFDGTLYSLESFDQAGTLDGPYETYYTNGNIEEKSTYVKGSFDGEVLIYHPNGALQSRFFYKNGKRNGKRSNYNRDGQLVNEGMLVDGEYTGDYKLYHTNGQIELACKVVKGNIVGDVTYYYKSGKIRSAGTFIEGNHSGMWKFYYENGKVMSEGAYVNDKEAGKWMYYYESGKLKEEANFDTGGKLKGTMKSYDEAGILWDETVYKNGKADSYKVYDTKGAIISQNKTGGGKLTLVNYSRYRTKVSEGMLVNSKEEDVWKYYYPNGALKYEVPCKGGEMNGILTYYFKNGKTNYELNYENGKREGFYRSYYVNGVVQTEGYYKNDEQHGPWSFYSANGTLDATEFYQEGSQDGAAQSYMPDNKLYTESIYRYGFLNSKMQYDTLGKVINKLKLVNGSGDYQLVSLTGKPTFTVKYVGGKAHGNCVNTFGNGKLRSSETYVYGKLNGLSKTYFENGKPNVVGVYDDNEMDSTWTYYAENGTLSRAIQYKNGQAEGFDKSYNDLGKLEFERYNKDDARHGDYTFYGADGTIIYRGTYVNGVLKSYTWLGKDGTLLPPTLVTNETVEVNTFYPSGSKGLSFTLEKGYLQGSYIIYFPDGKKYEDKKLIDNNYEGEYLVYYPNGNLKTKKNFLFDCLNGNVFQYYEDGKIASETPYLMDYKHGVAKYYDKTGKLTKKVKYVYGTIYE